MPRKTVAALVLLATFGAGVGFGALGQEIIGWRIKAYARKAMGDLPELSWSELIEMTVPFDGYGLSNFYNTNRSLNASIVNPHVSEADVAEGKRLFAANCAMCHGDDGAGSAGPSLRRASFDRGDSEFALYRLLRDGLPQTAMLPAALEFEQRWQVVAFVRSLQHADRAQELASRGFTSTALVPIDVSPERLASAGERDDEWLTYSGNARGWRYSGLDSLTPDTVSGLQLIWSTEFPSQEPGQTSTPLAVDGRLFVSETFGNVIAADARTGAVLWRYDHDVAERVLTCCGPVNRGVAIARNLVIVATLDANLVALDANTGAVRWQTAVADPEQDYAMTVAPLVVDDLVVVGVSGGEFATRGFIAAYDFATGAESWRFDTIPGPGEAGHETWLSDAWQTGGGPAWVTGSHDSELDLLYWGVGNPAPEFNGEARPGDNLYTNSMVALRPATGELVWHFQFTPHDVHDWDAAQTPILAELEIDGALRRVLALPNRNAFYYVLDRENGKFLRGTPFVFQNWADGLDENGRPMLARAGNAAEGGRLTYPSSMGASNWYPSAYDPSSRTIFVHANSQGSIYTQSPSADVEPRRGALFLGSGAVDSREPAYSVRALDAVSGEPRWIYEEDAPTQASGISGLLATGGGLLFGATGGRLFALDSSTGRELWASTLAGNTRGPPITFALDGRQAIAVWGGNTLYLFAL